MNSSLIEQGQIKFPVMEHFYTLQGEGTHQGKAAYFIRLGGCDVGCVWCDVKESWDAQKHPMYTVSSLLNMVKQAMPEGIVVITGGEPALYDLSELTNQFQSAGYRCHLETSGAHPIKGTWDWICLSPKKFKAPLRESLQLANELKVVVFNSSDFTWAELHAKETTTHCALFLQPEWDKREKVTPGIIEYIQQHPSWRLSLQVHKYLNIP